MISLECAVGLYARALIAPGLCDWPTLIARLTTGPARVLRNELGALGVGRPADVTIIDPARQWTVRLDRFVSRSRNCPYDGWRLQGRPVATLVAGEVKFRLQERV
jgi:dihydroorotase